MGLPRYLVESNTSNKYQDKLDTSNRIFSKKEGVKISNFKKKQKNTCVRI